MAGRLEIAPDDWPALARLIEQFGSVGGIADALQRVPASTRPRRQPVAFRNASEVNDAYSLKLVTKAEARKLFGLRTPRRAAAGRRPAGPE